jgi:hypothetical protein
MVELRSDSIGTEIALGSSREEVVGDMRRVSDVAFWH